MNRHMNFLESEFSNKKRVTKKEAFLAVMEEVEKCLRPSEPRVQLA